MEVLAIIPARGGSKGLPRKNVLPLAGKPLIAYTIEQALAAEQHSGNKKMVWNLTRTTTVRLTPIVNQKEFSGLARRGT